MEFDWNVFRNNLQQVGGNSHRFMPPCRLEHIKSLEAREGGLPSTIISMLQIFNGAELFVDAIPMVTILGVSTDPPQPRLVWPIECCVGHWANVTKSISRAGWPFARTNYGSLWILEQGLLREAEIMDAKWLGDCVGLAAWTHLLVDKGKIYLARDRD